MARLYLLIDGYNLMLSGSGGRVVLGPGDLQQARNRLLMSLRNWLDADIAADACIVFDSRKAPGTALRLGTSDVPPDVPFQVVFATNRPTAAACCTPCPEKPQALIQPWVPGIQPRMGLWSGVTS